MKKIIAFCLPILFVILSCNTNENITSPSSDSNKGGLILKIDRESAPDGVIVVEAILTNSELDTLTDDLNLLTDSDAEILLEDVAVGKWNLIVNAKDSLGVVLYTGETEVNVLAGLISEVYLVLEPTGEGTGSIYIYVTWGNTLSHWNDYPGNPILSTSGNYWDNNYVSQPKVLLDDGTYRMYYTTQGSAYSGYIALAFSNDGIAWQTSSNNPVLSPGPAGTWDDMAVAAATVIKDDDGYKMYYHGWSDPWGYWNIGLAISTDGVNWEKYPEPVLYAEDGWEFHLAPSCVIKNDGLYYLYYSEMNTPYLRISLATSIDGIHWNKNSSNPILVADKSWENTGVYYPTVYKQDDQFIMFYMNNSGTGFGKATSTDGVNWTKDNKNPFFTVEDTHNNWANNKIAYPNFVRVNDKYRIYYSGYSDYDSQFKIGFVTE